MNGLEVRRVRPGFDVVVPVPGSKSIANRALVCAALADRASVLRRMPDGDDTVAMTAALGALGLDVAVDDDRVEVRPAQEAWPSTTLHAGLAGTTSRFLTALAALGSVPITIDGLDPLRARPFEVLHDALRQMGVAVTPEGGRLPATICGPPSESTVHLRGDVSSQYVSALMMIAPALPHGLVIELTSPLVSAPYVELTAAVMSWFGVGGVEIDERTIVVPAGRYGGAEVEIEPDASSASYPLAVAAIAGGRSTIPGLGLGALQGDARFAEICGAMGCGVTRTVDRVTVEAGAGLHGIDIDMSDISDLVPTVAVLAAAAGSPTRIRGVGFIRAKESDRLGDLAAELRTLGIEAHETADGLDVAPSADRWHGGRVGTHHDHRLAMAFGVLGARLPGVVVDDPEVVTKSWPAFWAMLEGLAAR